MRPWSDAADCIDLDTAGEAAGLRELYLKLEVLQPIGSFKIRSVQRRETTHAEQMKTGCGR